VLAARLLIDTAWLVTCVELRIEELPYAIVLPYSTCESAATSVAQAIAAVAEVTGAAATAEIAGVAAVFAEAAVSLKLFSVELAPATAADETAKLVEPPQLERKTARTEISKNVRTNLQLGAEQPGFFNITP
jgi:hypothetical protein